MPTPSSWPLAILAFLGLLLAACDRPSEEETADNGTGVSQEPGAGANDSSPPALPRTPSPAGARVFFISPEDGATVTNPVRIEFGAEGMTLAKAGDPQPDSGHHHLIVDAGMPDLNLPIPADENYIHFGDASTSTELTLSPGQHTLRLLLGDHLHIPHDPPVASETITITVQPPSQ